MPSANLPYWKIYKVPEAVAAEQGWRNCSLLEALVEGNGSLVASLSHGVMVEDISSGSWLLTNKEVCIGCVTMAFFFVHICLSVLDYRSKSESRVSG